MRRKYVFKFILVGDSHSGKSCLLNRFVSAVFQPLHDLTVGVEYNSRTICINEDSVKLQIWDTAGQEIYQSLTKSFYRQSTVALVVYDISNRDSFDNAQKWLDEIKQYCLPFTPLIVVVGNKCDLAYGRKVSSEEGQQLAFHYHALFFETSAKTGVNSEAIFIEAVRCVILNCKNVKNSESNLRKQGIRILQVDDIENLQAKREGCCFLQ
jgi:Ras-related protein Rab-2A